MGIYGMGKAFNLRYQQTQAAPRRMNMNTRFQAGPPSLMGYGGFGGQSITNITYNNGPTGFWGFMSGFLNSGVLNNLGSGSLFGNQGVRQQQPQGNTPAVQQQQQQQQPVQEQEQQQEQQPVQQQEQQGTPAPKLRGTAKDNVLLSARGVTTNSATGAAQWVDAKEGNLEITGDKAKPSTITMKDDTNGHTNTYTYTLLTDDQVTAKGLDPAKGPYYTLSSATRGTTDLKLGHEEIYKLDASTDNTYNLYQDSDLTKFGAGRSSIDYSQK